MKFYHGLAIILVLLYFIPIVGAHQPRLAPSNATIEDPIIISNPEISQAFYGELKGKPVYYRIDSKKPFRLYVNILIPSNPMGGELVSVEIFDKNGRIFSVLDAYESEWEPYFEEFGGDNYFKGPEFKMNLSEGTYYIKVFNENNSGKYSLAVGDIESFPPDEALKAIFLLPILKTTIFEVPIVELFFQFLGLILGMGIFISFYISDSLISKDIRGKFVKVSWMGLILTTIAWGFHHLQNPLNILGNIASIVLIIIIALTWRFNRRIGVDKMRFTGHLLLVFWVIFLFLRVTLI